MLHILFHVTTLYAQNKSAEQIQVERAVINWASETFEYYEGPRFENYKKLPTKEQYKLENQIADLKEYKTEMTDEYNSGNLKKTKEEFEKNINTINAKIDSLNNVYNQISKSTDIKNDYEIDFWANIKANNGLTVYYRHYILLNNNFEVIKAEITGIIGKESDDIKILYKTKEAEEKYQIKKIDKPNHEKEQKTETNNTNSKTHIKTNTSDKNKQSAPAKDNTKKKQTNKSKY